MGVAEKTHGTLRTCPCEIKNDMATSTANQKNPVEELDDRVVATKNANTKHRLRKEVFSLTLGSQDIPRVLLRAPRIVLSQHAGAAPCSTQKLAVVDCFALSKAGPALKRRVPPLPRSPLA